MLFMGGVDADIFGNAPCSVFYESKRTYKLICNFYHYDCNWGLLAPNALKTFLVCTAIIALFRYNYDGI